MLELTYKNHFRFGYNGVPWSSRADAGDHWFADYGPCERAPLDFGSECVATARTIASQAEQDIWVLFSGGIDSELVLRAFHAAGIRVRAAILRFKHDLNVHDISYAVIACESLGVHYRFFDLDLESFLASDAALALADETRCLSPQLLPTMWCMGEVPGYPVLGSGDCYLVRRAAIETVSGHWKYRFTDSVAETPGAWDLWEKEKIAAWYRYLLRYGKAGCAGFFQYTPELMLAFLREPEIAVCVGTAQACSSTPSKFPVYSRYFPLVARPKYNGYERALHIDQKFRPRFEEKHKAANSVYRTGYADLLRQLAGYVRGPSSNMDERWFQRDRPPSTLSMTPVT